MSVNTVYEENTVQLLGNWFLLQLHGFQASKSGHRVWQAAGAFTY